MSRKYTISKNGTHGSDDYGRPFEYIVFENSQAVARISASWTDAASTIRIIHFHNRQIGTEPIPSMEITESVVHSSWLDLESQNLDSLVDEFFRRYPRRETPS